jgi:GntR family transcriptional regulator
VLISIDTHDPRPIYIQIVDEIRRALVLGILPADAPLPSVRQLAIDLRLNPNTVAQAYRELERLDLVYVKRGQGTFARPAALNGDERHSLATDVARRAIQDAHRNGLTEAELIDAIQRETTLRQASES